MDYIAYVNSLNGLFLLVMTINKLAYCPGKAILDESQKSNSALELVLISFYFYFIFYPHSLAYSNCLNGRKYPEIGQIIYIGQLNVSPYLSRINQISAKVLAHKFKIQAIKFLQWLAGYY